MLGADPDVLRGGMRRELQDESPATEWKPGEEPQPMVLRSTVDCFLRMARGGGLTKPTSKKKRKKLNLLYQLSGPKQPEAQGRVCMAHHTCLPRSKLMARLDIG